MRTSEKLERLEADYPVFLSSIREAIELGEYREVDRLVNGVKHTGKRYIPKFAKEYVITLLCDELTRLTNENLSEE